MVSLGLVANIREALTMHERTTIYDEIPYPELTHSHTHPTRMETLASILGLKPAPVDNCRVLELGCATGSNVLPMAYAYPESQFVGLDNSAVQIENGIKSVEELELENVELRIADIMETQADLGSYDYIIAHGFYSWVPEVVQNKLLRVCRQHLAPRGVVYVSYNTYPGWHLMGMVRDMMLYHVRHVDDPLNRAAKARELIEFLARSLESSQSAYSTYLEKYLEILGNKQTETMASADSLMIHDELAEVNRPTYFYKFIEHASRHGLQYLVESEFAQAMPAKYSTEVQDQIRKMARDTTDMEQYLDYLNFRTFRRTLLCRDEIEVNRMIRPEVIFDLQMSSRARPIAKKEEIAPGNVSQFKGHDGAVFSTDHSLTVAAFGHLAQIYPAAAPFREIVRRAVQAHPIESDESLAEHTLLVAANFLRAYGYSESLVEFFVHPPRLTAQISANPQASLIARWQADHMRKVTNMRHERVELDDMARSLLRYLDGRTDRKQLLAIMNRDYEDGRFVMPTDESENKSTAKVRNMMVDEVDSRLRFFAKASLLVS